MRIVSRIFTDPIVYGHAAGRIKVLETKLFTKARVERLIQAHDLAEQLVILGETDHGAFFEDVYSAVQVEDALNKYLAAVYDFLEEVCKKKEIIRFFRLKYDYHNLKVMLKKKYLGEENERIWLDLGILSIEKAKEAIQKGAPDMLPEPYSSDARRAIRAFEKKKDAQVIDLVFDRGLYHEWHKIAQNLDNSYLLNFAETAIDLANLRTFLRARNLAKKVDFIREALFDNGSLAKERLISLYPRSMREVASELSSTAYGPILDNVVREDGKFDSELLDKMADNFLVEYTKKAKIVAVGPEPVVGYIVAKENEVNMIRIILIGRLNGLPTSVIEERVRDLYV